MPKTDRQAIYERDGGLCGFCGQSVPLELLHLDHYPVPRSRGGRAVPNNLRVAHKRCNLADGGHLAALSKAELRPDEDPVAITVRFPTILRKRALGVAMDEDRTFASLVIYALRRYVDAADRATPKDEGTC